MIIVIVIVIMIFVIVIIITMISETDLAQATFSAARASFCSDSDRKELMKELRKEFGIEDKVELEIFINHKCGQPDDPRKVLKTSF